MKTLALTVLLCWSALLCGQTAPGGSPAAEAATPPDSSGAENLRPLDDALPAGTDSLHPASAFEANPFGRLEVTVDGGDVEVTVDGRPAGVAPVIVDSLLPGLHIVRLLPPDPSSWLIAARTDTVMIRAGELASRAYELPQWYSISSIPAGASVTTNDSLAGVTPLLLPAGRLTSGTRIGIAGEGFRPATATLDDFMRGTLLVRLEPTSPEEMPDLLASRDRLPEPPSSTGLVVSGIASIGFGVAAAYFKGAADRAADRYTVTREPSLLEERDRLDKSAALAFVGMQVSVGFFVYFLLSR